MALQDRDTLKALITSSLPDNLTKAISAADLRAVVTNICDSVIFYNENANKANVRVATTANGTLATAFANGQTVDGVTLSTGNRILLKDQSTASENGVYTVNASGAPTRATDFDSGDDVQLGNTFYVKEGTANGGKFFYLSAPTGTITIGSSNLVFGVLGASFDINGLSAFSGTIDTTNDYLAMYDASAGANRKIAASRLAPVYGTFTPAIAFGGGTTGITYGTRTGTYSETILNDNKIKVDFNIYIIITADGSSTGAMTFTGLPRTANGNYIVNFSYGDNATGAAFVGTPSLPITPVVISSTTTIGLYKNQKIDSSNAVVDGDIVLGGGSLEFYVSGYYIHTP